MQFFRKDGVQTVPVTKKEVRVWIRRCRENLTLLEHALQTNDALWFSAYAHDLSGSAAELENIGDTTCDSLQG